MSKPYALIFTDPHYNKKNHGLVNKVLFQALDRAVELKIKYLICCGDVFTDRVGRSLEDLLAFTSFLEELSERDLFLYLIPGNHDKTDLKSKSSYLDIFDFYPNVKVFNDFGLKMNPGNEPDFAFLPFFEDKIFKEKVKVDFSKKTKNLILFTHQAIDGVKNNDGSVVKDSVAPSSFKRFEKVIVGHYHNRQSFDNIHYIGSTHAQNFGEDNKKGWAVLYENCDLILEDAVFPKYVRIKIDITKRTGLLILQKAIKKYQFSQDNIRFVIAGKPSQLSSIAQDIIDMRKKGIDVQTKDIEVVETMNSEADKKVIEMKHKDLLTYFEEWVDNQEEMGEERKILGLKYLENVAID